MTVEATVQTLSAPRWRRIARHPNLMEYWWLAGFVVAANALWLAQVDWNMLRLSQGGFNLASIANAALANFTLAILIRQQRVINTLFWLATRIPTNWPLWLRWKAGKVFHFGGLHVGGAFCGSLWFAALLGALAWNAVMVPGSVSMLTLAASGVILALLMAMLVTALPALRSRFHDTFERTHRFAGWTVLALFWVQSLSLLIDLGIDVRTAPAPYALGVITLSVLSPWLALKRVPVDVERLSSHAASLRFDYGDTPFPGSSNAISVSPLMEWHSFANIPAPGESGYRLIVSRAGDWTGCFIDNPPSHVWVKGVTTSGVARIELLFKKVVYVATGSGIGPVLPHLLAGDVPSHLIWSTRSPRETYGDALVDEIVEASPDALIWDTTRRGKPDLSQLALQAVREHGAEAVICIANQKLTRRVVHDVESLGIPAYGAIWDS